MEASRLDESAGSITCIRREPRCRLSTGVIVCACHASITYGLVKSMPLLTAASWLLLPHAMLCCKWGCANFPDLHVKKLFSCGANQIPVLTAQPGERLCYSDHHWLVPLRSVACSNTSDEHVRDANKGIVFD